MPENLKDIQNSIFVPFYTVNEATGHGFPTRSSWTQFQGNQGQQLVNCWAEVHKSDVGDSGEVLIQKRPGINLDLDTNTATLQTAWDTQFANWNGAPNAANADLRTIKDSICVTQLEEVMVTAAVHFSPGAPGTAVLKIVIWNPYSETAAVHEIATYNDSAVGNVNNAFDTRDEVYLNEFGTVPLLAGTGGNVTPAVSIVWIRHDKARSAAWTMDWTGAAFAAPAQIVTNQFATHYATRKVLAGNFAMLNGRAHIMTQDGYIWSSEIGAMGNAAASWQDRTAAPMYTNAISYPDKGIGVMRYKHHIVAFGQDSIEFFSDAGKERGSPLSATDQAFIKFGAINAGSIINVEDTLYWLAAGTKLGIGGLWKLEGYTPTKLSHDAFDTWLAHSGQSQLNPAVWREIRLTSMRMFGKTHVVVTGLGVTVFDNLVGPMHSEITNTNSEIYRASNSIGGTPPINSSAGFNVFNVNDKTWWVLVHQTLGLTSTDSGLAGAHIFPVIPMVLRVPFGAGTSPIYSPDRVYVMSSKGENIYKVASSTWAGAGAANESHLFMDSSTDSQEIWVPVLIKSNILDFGRNARKILEKVAIISKRSYGDVWDVTNQGSPGYEAAITPGYVEAGSDETAYKQLLAIAKAQVDALSFNNMVALTWLDTGRIGGSLYSEAAMAPTYDSLYLEGEAPLAVSPMANRAKLPVRYIDNYNPYRQERITFHRCGTFRQRQMCFFLWTAGDWVGRGWEFNVTQLVS